MRLECWLVPVAALLLISMPAAGSGAPTALGAEARLDGTQTDAAGRVVLDNQDARRFYSTPPETETSPWLARDSAATHSSRLARTPGGLQIELEWYFAVAGTGIGSAGMEIANIDAIPGLELVASASVGGFGSNNFWYVLESKGSGYERRWTSFEYDNPIDRLIVQQLDADGALEILIATGGHLLVYDGASLELVADLSIPTGRVFGLAAADVDADPSPEVAFCSDSGTWVFDLFAGLEEWSDPSLSCTDLAIGETDGTPGLELVVADSSDPGIVVDGATGNVEWTHPLGFGDWVSLGDLDNDFMEEIAAGFAWSGIQVWNGDTHSFVFEVPIFNLATLTFADVEGDGPIELLYGDAQWGEVHVLDGTSAEKWSVSNPEHGVTRIAVGDLDQDGSQDLFFGAGYTSTGPDHLYAVDCLSQAIEWQSDDISGPFFGLSHGDIDADGDPEVVFTSFESESGYGDGLYFVYDARTREREFKSAGPTGSNWTGLWKVAIGDVDQDVAEEVFLPTSHTYTGALQCIDGVTHDIQWEESLVSGLTFQSMRLGDPDRDGEVEVALGAEVQHTGAPGLYAYIYDAASGQLEWQSFDLQNFFGFWSGLDLLRVSDIDDDGIGELVIASTGQGLIVIDPILATIDLAVDSVAVTALETLDLSGDGVDEIVLGTESGTIVQVDPVTGLLDPLAPGPYPGAISGLAMVDLTGDRVFDFVFAADDRLYLVNGATLVTEWESERLGSGVGESDSLTVADVDGDGVTEIWVNAGRIGHLTFGVTTADSQIFSDGFESGDTSAWSPWVR